MMRILTLFCLIVFNVSSAAAQDSSSPPNDPVLGARLVEGVATAHRLWLRSASGAVVAFDRANGERRIVVEQGAADLLRDSGRTLILKSDGATPSRFSVFDPETGFSLTPALRADALGLLRVGPDWVVVTKDALYRSDGGRWRRQAIEGSGRRFGVRTMASTPDRSIYIGFNYGEWGGGLWRIAPGSSKMVEVRKVDNDPCHGPLAAECDPITGLVPDVDHPGCLLASIGLDHMLSHGRLMRICGDEATLVFSRELDALPGSIEAFAHSTWPLFGLAATPDGWLAIAPGKVFISSGGEVQTIDMPKATPFADIQVSQVGQVLILPTDVNWGMSLSGYTPMLVPVTD
ncbi:hypothetical protein [Brevundimonas sp. UBA5718]|uniref:hypothetical protein n=2 Tax=Brevundimonas TaxID=41275 RepID=UPI0025C164EC|nr:hypothetical protein [Brevundimonas sp. UBA5718]MCK6104166.1 hypothetical protein [Brevundimonas sp. EYE_349]